MAALRDLFHDLLSGPEPPDYAPARRAPARAPELVYEPTEAQQPLEISLRPIAAPSSDRKSRIVHEVMMIAPYFTKHEGVAFDEANADWLMIPKYPLPAKWQARWCKLLIVFPETYPISPPIGFYLNRQFRLKGGALDYHLLGIGSHGAPNLVFQGWHWYCCQTVSGPGGWKPSTDYREPDNLWKYLNMVREVLTNDA
jgi:hypothetical protein